jgi:hypothetical protein
VLGLIGCLDRGAAPSHYQQQNRTTSSGGSLGRPVGAAGSKVYKYRRVPRGSPGGLLVHQCLGSMSSRRASKGSQANILVPLAELGKQEGVDRANGGGNRCMGSGWVKYADCHPCPAPALSTGL